MNNTASTVVARVSSVAPLRAPNAAWLLDPRTRPRCRRRDLLEQDHQQEQQRT